MKSKTKKITATILIIIFLFSCYCPSLTNYLYELNGLRNEEKNIEIEDYYPEFETNKNFNETANNLNTETPKTSSSGEHKITVEYYKAYIWDTHDPGEGEWHFKLYAGGRWTGLTERYYVSKPKTVDFRDRIRTWYWDPNEETSFEVWAGECDYELDGDTDTCEGWDYKSTKVRTVSISDKIWNEWNEGSRREGDVTHYYRIKPENLQPTVITFNAEGYSTRVQYTCSATDPESDSIVKYEWNFGDGISCTTSTKDTEHKYAQGGRYNCSVRAKDEYGMWSQWKTLKNFNVKNIANISSPNDGTFLSYGKPTTFVGIGIDTENSDISQSNFIWESNIDKFLSSGSEFVISNLSVGKHVITLTVIDNDGDIGNDTIDVYVGADFAIYQSNIKFDKYAKTTTINATVTNEGADFEGEVIVQFFDEYIDGNNTVLEKIGTDQKIQNLLHDQKKTVSVKWNPKVYHVVKVVIDPDKIIGELKESNNIAQKGAGGHTPYIVEITSDYGIWKEKDGIDTLGTFIRGIEVGNLFTVDVGDLDGVEDVKYVIFKLNDKEFEADKIGESLWECELEMGDLNAKPKKNILEITAEDEDYIISETKIIHINAIELPEWVFLAQEITEGLESVGLTMEWVAKDQKYIIKLIIPSSAGQQIENDRDIPGGIPGVGGGDSNSEFYIGLELSYYVTEEISFWGGGYFKINISGYDVFIAIHVDVSFEEDLRFKSAYVYVRFEIPFYSAEGEMDCGWASIGFGVAIGLSITIEALIQAINEAIKLTYIAIDLGLFAYGWVKTKIDIGIAMASFYASIFASIHFKIAYNFYEKYFKVSLYGKPGFQIEWKLEWKLLFISGKLSGKYRWDFEVSSPEMVNKTLEENPWSFEKLYTTFADSRPRVAADSNGNAMMIWVKNEIIENKTYSDIYYSIWNGTDWGESDFINFDEQADFDPALTYDSEGNVIAVWTRIMGDQSTHTIDNPFDILKSQEIVYSIWNGSAWSTTKSITNDICANGRAVVSAGVNGTALAVWVGDSDANFTTTNDMELYYSIWNGSSWAPKNKLTENNYMDYSASLAHDSEGNAILCWIRDLDGDPSTTLDRELRYANWDGNIWISSGLVTVLNETKDSPSITFDLNDNALITWVGGNEDTVKLYYASKDKLTGNWSEPELVHEDAFFIYDPAINVDSNNTAVIVWRGFEDDDEEKLYYLNHTATETYFDGEICYATKDLSKNDSIWSKVKYLTSDNKTDWMISAVIIRGHSNDLLLVWEKEGDLSKMIHELKPDLSITNADISFSNKYPSEEENIIITARISNIGDIEAHNIQVDLYDGEPNEGGIFIDSIFINVLKNDATVNVTLPWKATSGIHDIYIRIDSKYLISELNESNNKAYKSINILPELTLSSNDIVFSNINPLENEIIKINAKIHNQGGTKAKNVTIQFYSNENLINSATISSIDANSVETVSIDWKAIADYTNITIIIDPNNEIIEWNEINNYASTSISILPDFDLVEFTISKHLLLTGESITCTTIIQNIGFAKGTNIQIEYYNGNPYNNGTLIACQNIDDLSINGLKTLTMIWTPNQGIHHVFVVIDRENLITEVNEKNNIKDDEILVRSLADLSLFESDILFETGSINFFLPIKNIGETGASGIVVALYDGNPIYEGIMIDSRTILYIPAKENVTISLKAFLQPDSGFFYFIIDPENLIEESNEDNNEVVISYILIPKVNAGPDKTVNEDEEVQFSGSAIVPGDIEDYTFEWDFGDGTTAIGKGIKHLYTDPGVFTAILYLADENGNIGSDTCKVTVLDNTPPITDVLLSGELSMNEWYISDITVMLNANDNFSAIAITEYSFDGINWIEYLEPFNITFEGTTLIFYRSTDTSNNIERIKTDMLNIDKTPPETMISLNGNPGNEDWFVSNVTVILVSTDATSGVNCTNYCFGGETIYDYIEPFIISSEGTTKLYFRAMDNAGNLEIRKSVSVNIDKTPPEIILNPSSKVITDGDSVIKFSWNVSDMSEIVLINVTLNNLLINTDPIGEYQITNELGQYNLSVYAEDIHGLCNLISSQITIIDDDICPPELSNLVVIHDIHNVNISFNAIDETGIEDIIILVNGKEIIPISQIQGGNIYQFTLLNQWILKNGVYNVEIKVRDDDNDRLNDTLTSLIIGTFEITLEDMYRYVDWQLEELQKYIDNNLCWFFRWILNRKLSQARTILQQAYCLVESGKITCGLLHDATAKVYLRIIEFMNEILNRIPFIDNEDAEYIINSTHTVRNNIVILMGASVGTEQAYKIALIEIELLNLNDFIEEKIHWRNQCYLGIDIKGAAFMLEMAIFKISLNLSVDCALTCVQCKLERVKCLVTWLLNKGMISQELADKILFEINQAQENIEAVKNYSN